MAKDMTISDKGHFKESIQKALYKSSDIKDLLLGDTDGMSKQEIRKNFKDHVVSHLFIDDTIEKTDSFIFYDVMFPNLSPKVKNCKVLMYAICHRDILDNYYKEGFYGNRADILGQMIEDVLINDEKTCNSFGIGELTLDRVEIYNSHRFYGNIMTFNVPTFR